MKKQDDNYSTQTVRDGVTLTARLQSWGLLLLGMLAAVVAMVAVSIITVHLSTPRIVSFDMKGTMDMFIQQTLQQKLTEDQSKVLMQRFNTALTDSLTAWQAEHNVVILVAPAVVSTQPDITGDIRSDIAQKMKGGQ
ncbi:type-F conjugative transfer system protein TrbI [Siccibacter turicensis]|uniref:type-F conjugative transfer system protein TrbI n=1 Tax=Siccibacter TaxID=1649298 RepID=UPI00056D34BB|nr:type-F conjugative transfer system protein TrbI [Siccibacter turicensis]